MKYIKFLLITFIIPLFGSCSAYVSDYRAYNMDEISEYKYWVIEFNQPQSGYVQTIELSEEGAKEVYRPLYSPTAYQMKEDMFFFLMDYYWIKMVRKSGPDAGVIKIHPIFHYNSDMIKTMDIRLDSPDGRTLARLKMEHDGVDNETFSKTAARSIAKLIYDQTTN